MRGQVIGKTYPCQRGLLESSYSKLGFFGNKDYKNLSLNKLKKKNLSGDESNYSSQVNILYHQMPNRYV